MVVSHKIGWLYSRWNSNFVETTYRRLSKIDLKIGSKIRPFLYPVVELFWGSKLDPRVGLLTELKNRSFLGVEKTPKNALKNGLKMTPKLAQKMRPKMRKNAQNGQNSAQTHWD